MDILDHAQVLEETQRKISLNNRPRLSQQASRDTCLDCGASIPAARRLAVRGVQRCIDCQNQAET